MDPLHASVTKLYEVFARYPLRVPIESCPCCRGPEYPWILETKPLRELNEEDLSQFAGSAMTTIGDVDDFCRFLQRMFELLARDQYWSPEIAIGKLSLGEWLQWSVEEQEAVRGYMKELGHGLVASLAHAKLAEFTANTEALATVPQQNERIQEWTARLKKRAMLT